jgi:oligopeptide transport system ATP-binding protein
VNVLSLLDMREVTVELPTAAGRVKPVNDVSLRIAAPNAAWRYLNFGQPAPITPLGASSYEGTLTTCHSEGGVCPRNLLFTRLLPKPIPRFVRSDNYRDPLDRPETPMTPLLELEKLRKTYVRGGGLFSDQTKAERFAAVDDVTFEVAPGETFAIVGESDCGKTTLARILLRLIEPDEGKVLFEGHDMLALSGEALRAQRRQMQMIFQDPFASLNPRMRVGEIVAEPLAIHEPKLTRSERRERTREILRRVGHEDSALPLDPHEFSGGQRQRIGIARALILCPKLIVADEPVSALDVSVGAQVLLLLQQLQQEFHLTYVFISHSLPVARELLAAVPEIPRAAKV